MPRLELIAQNSGLRWVLLIVLFGLVVGGTYLTATRIAARQLTRRRLIDEGGTVAVETNSPGSLRSEQTEGAWLKLVNAIEKSGVSVWPLTSILSSTPE